MLTAVVHFEPTPSTVLQTMLAQRIMEHDMPILTKEAAKDLFRCLGTTCFDRALDTVLFLTLFLTLSSTHERSSRGVHRAGREANAILDAFNGETVRTWWKRLRAKGWIGRDLQVTKEGQQRLAGLMPTIRWHERWDHHWHLVSFDIPEGHRRSRDQLRSVLKRLGFGMLHASLWLSPRNLLGDVRAALSVPRTSRSIVFGTTERLGATESKSLAATIWALDALNERYKECLVNLRDIRAVTGDLAATSALLATLRDDPQLPQDLLPSPWHGFAALRAFERKFGPLLKLPDGSKLLTAVN